jgi:hypothetical protein
VPPEEKLATWPIPTLPQHHEYPDEYERRIASFFDETLQ